MHAEIYSSPAGTSARASAPRGWDNTVTITEKGGYFPSIAFNRNNIFAVYQKNIKENAEIYFIRSTNGGDTWSEEKQITTRGASSSEDTQILFCNNRLYIFWTDFNRKNIYFSYSKDPEGRRFAKPILAVKCMGDLINLTTAAAGDKIILLWSNKLSIDYELFTAQSTSLSGLKWSKPVQITKYSGNSFYPSLTSIMDEFYLVWQQRDGPNYKIMYSKSKDAVNWARKPASLSQGLNNAYSPSIIACPEGVITAFQGENDDELDIYVTLFNSYEETWSIPVKISRNLNIERYPVIINSINELYLFWLDKREGYEKIIYRKSSDNGLTWNDASCDPAQSEKNIKNFKAVYNFFNSSIYLMWEEGDNGKICFTGSDRFCPAPVITDSSHKENKWSIKKDVNIKWKINSDASGIKEYAYVMDHNPDTIPEFYIKNHPMHEANFYNLNDNIWYFHINARDHADNISKTAHYQIMINSSLYTGKEEYYIIKYGDTLWDVSKKFYKNPTYFKIIAEYNNIINPELIYPHQILKIPPLNSIAKK